MASDSVKIVIYPAGADSDSLTVADAMQQVLDYIELLSKAEVKDTRDNVRVVWRLKRASTNTPLTIEAEPFSSDPAIPVDRQAALAKFAVADGIGKILRAEERPAWIDDEAEDTVRRILARSLNGIRRTDYFPSDDAPPTILDARGARRAQNYLEVLAAEEAAKEVDLSRKEHGSVEGYVTSVTTHYGKPAITVRARLSGREVKCVVSEAQGKEHDWEEVWRGRRALVAGTLHYDRSGALTFIDAERVKILKSRDVPANEVQDPQFSGGLKPSDHLKKIWGDSDG